MPTTIRVNFTKGIYGSLEPRLIGDGFAAVIHNVDLRSGIAKPAKAPVLDSSVPANTVWSWEFLGVWYHTPEIRDWVGEVVGVRNQIYYTIPGQSVIPPQKIIIKDGTPMQAQLGTPKPTTAPVVVPFEDSAAGSVSIVATMNTVPSSALKKGSYEFKILNKDARGNIVGRGSSDAVVAVEGVNTITLDFTNLPNSSLSELYAKCPDEKQFFLFAANSGSPLTVDSLPNIDYAKPWPSEDAEVTPITYIYTNCRTVNGQDDESGPSDPSVSVVMGHGRKITIESIGAAGFVPDGTRTYNNPVASALAGSTALTVGTLSSSAGRTTIVTTTNHGLVAQDRVVVTENAADGLINGSYTITPVADPTPFAASSIFPSFSPSASDGWPNGSYKIRLVKVVGLTYADWLSSLVSINRGAWSAASGDISFTISGGAKQIHFVIPPDNSIDSVVAFVQKDGGTWYAAFMPTDGTPHGGGVTGYKDGTVILACPGGVWPSGFGTMYAGNPPPPTTSNVSLLAFSIATTMKNPQARVAWPTVTKGAGVQINVGAALTGYVNGQQHTIKLTGFALNAHLNSIFRSTVTDAATGKVSIGLWFNPSGGATETSSGQAVFGTASAGSTTDAAALITKRTLYRIGDSTEYLKVADISPNDTEYIDTIATNDLGVIIPTFYTENGISVIFAPPPADLHGIVQMGGIKIGISGHTVRWTPVGHPDAWPEVYSMAAATSPVKLVPVGGSVITFCDGLIGRLELGSPTQAFWQTLPTTTGCTAPLAIVPTPKGIIFPGQDGLMILDVGRNQAFNLFPNRVSRRLMLSPSIPTVNFGHWWMPGNKSFAYNYLTRDLPGAKRAGMAAHLDEQPTYPTAWMAPRAFYSNSRYYLYYWDQTSYQHHGMFEINMEGQEPVLTLNGVRPMGHHVTTTGNAYVLLPASTGVLATVQALEGADPDTDTGMGSMNTATPSLYRFGDELGTPGVIHIRSGPMNASLNDRVTWKAMAIHGVGTGSVRVWLDGWEVTNAGAAQFVASESPSDSRVIKMPRGSDAYSLDFEITGALNLLACEFTFDPMPSE